LTLTAEAPPLSSVRTMRQAVSLIVVINLLVLGIGLVAAVDLRRLRTPGGTALRWVQAAVFGVCDDYLDYSLPARNVQDTRSRAELCRDLSAATQQARSDQLKIGLHLGAVVQRVNSATVAVVLTRDGAPTRLTLHLVRRQGHWRVLRDEATCGSVGCA
jgi:hypothetical protein